MRVVSGNPRPVAPRGVRVTNLRAYGAFVKLPNGKVVAADSADEVTPTLVLRDERSPQGAPIESPIGKESLRGLDLDITTPRIWGGGFGPPYRVEKDSGLGAVPSAISSTLPVLIDSIEVRSAFAPPQKFKLSELLKPSDTPPNPVLAQLKPTIILKGGTLGTQVIAPAGEVSADAWKGNVAKLAVGAALVTGGVWYLIYRIGVRAGRRGR